MKHIGLLIGIFLLGNKTYSQNANSWLNCPNDVPNSLFEDAWLRVCYFGNLEEKIKAQEKLVGYYANTQQWNQCIRFSDTLALKDDSLSRQILKYRTRSFIKIKRFNSASLQLKYWQSITKDSLELRSIYFYWVIVGLSTRNWETVLSYSDSLTHIEGLEDSLKPFRRKYRSEKWAMGLNVIPGLGEAYAGEWGRAYRAFLFNGGVIALLAFTTNNTPLITFALGAQWLGRYYVGGFINASKSANMRNHLIDYELMNYWIKMIELSKPKF